LKQRLPIADQRTGSRGSQARGAANTERRNAERGRTGSGAPDWVARPTRPVERPTLPHKVVSVGHVNQIAASGKLAAELCAAWRREVPAVSALVTIDNAGVAQDARVVFADMMEAGAAPAKLVSKPQSDAQRAPSTSDAQRVLCAAVEELGTDWVIAWGNALPQLFRPFFSIVVTGHRRDLVHTDAMVIQADLEVTAPGPELATLLARRLASAKHTAG